MNLFQRQRLKFFFLLCILTIFTIGTQTAQAQDCNRDIRGLQIEGFTYDDIPVFCNRNGSFCVNIDDYDTSLELGFITFTQDGQILAWQTDNCFSTDGYLVTAGYNQGIVVLAINFDPETLNPNDYNYFTDLPFDDNSICFGLSETIYFEIVEVPEIYLSGFHCATSATDIFEDTFVWYPEITFTNNIVSDFFLEMYSLTLIREDGSETTYNWTDPNTNNGTDTFVGFAAFEPSESFSIVVSNGFNCWADTLKLQAPNSTCESGETCGNNYTINLVEPFEIPCIFEENVLNPDDEFELLSYEVFTISEDQVMTMGESIGTFEISETDCAFTYFPIAINENIIEGITYTATVNGVNYTCSTILNFEIPKPLTGGTDITCLPNDNGGADAQLYELYLEVSGGIAPYTIEGTINTTLQSEGGVTMILPIGTGYNITITDAQGETTSLSSDGMESLEQCINTRPMTVTISQNCITDDEGNIENTAEYEVNFNISKGLPPYQLNINGEISTFDLSGDYTALLAVGLAYDIVFTDAVGTVVTFTSDGEAMAEQCGNNISGAELNVVLTENCGINANGEHSIFYEIYLEFSGGLAPYTVKVNEGVSSFHEAAGFSIIFPLGYAYNISVTDAKGESKFFESDGKALLEQCGDNIAGSELMVWSSNDCVLNEYGNLTSEYELNLTIFGGLPPYEIDINGEITNLEDIGIYKTLLSFESNYDITVTDALGLTKSFSNNSDNVFENCSFRERCNIGMTYPEIILDNHPVGSILYCSTDTIKLRSDFPTEQILFIITNKEGDILAMNNSGIFPIEALALELEDTYEEIKPYVIVSEEGDLSNVLTLTNIHDIWYLVTTEFGVCRLNDLTYPPLIVLPPIKATVDIMCDKLGGEDYEAYHLNVKVTGGLPAYEGTGTYTFSGGLNVNNGEFTTLVYDPVSKSAEGQIVASSGELFMLGETYTFQIIDDAWSCASIVYSETPTLPICITTPIDLVSFNANADTEGNTIQWTTAHELDHDYFILEYATANGSFERLTIIAAEGNEGQGAAYEWHHPTQKTGIHYYRLIAVDRHGERVDHGVVTVERKDHTGRAVQISPIPAADQVQVNWTTDMDRVAITLYNTMGQAMFHTMTEGNELNIPVHQLPAGIYYLSLDLGEEMWNEKIIVE